MYIIATASADTYITNKIVDGLRVEDSNVGRAGTLDLFKLYDETLSGSTGGHTELSRILLKFDTTTVQNLASSSFNVNSNDFKAKVRLQSIQSNLPVPRNFTVSMFPLAREFTEGDGRDVSGFTDIDSANYLSPKLGETWYISGAYQSGSLGDSNIDYYESGDLGSGIVSLESKQNFYDGTEDLLIDVTKIVSATISNVLPNYGFLMAFTSSQEQDQTTRFVKRFASRHVRNEILRPRLEIYDNTYTVDSHSIAMFDVAGAIYLKNITANGIENLLSSSLAITGSDCLIMRLTTGSYINDIQASQISNGIYKAEYFISAQDSSIITGTITLSDCIAATGSITFNESWMSLDNTVTFSSGSLKFSMPTRTSTGDITRRLIVKTTNAKSKYAKNTTYRMKSFAYDPDYEVSVSKFSKPINNVITTVFYQIRDDEGHIIIPFEKDNNATRLSSDENGMYFDMHTHGFPTGKLLTIDYFVNDRGSEYVIEDKNAKFVVE
jgi:hypothetical protein